MQKNEKKAREEFQKGLGGFGRKEKKSFKKELKDEGFSRRERRQATREADQTIQESKMTLLEELVVRIGLIEDNKEVKQEGMTHMSQPQEILYQNNFHLRIHYFNCF